MLTILQIRILVCFLLFTTVALSVAFVVMMSEWGIPIRIIEWDIWAGLASQVLLLGFYGYSVRRHVQFNKWGRAAFVVVFSGFAIFVASYGIYRYYEVMRDIYTDIYFFNCSDSDDYSVNLCCIDRSKTTIMIVAACITVIEALYILRKGPEYHSQSAGKPDNIITVSPPHHPYGIQPNMTVPYGEPQPQHLVYQQPMYPQLHPQQPFHHPYPAMQPAGGGAAMPLQHIPQHQTSFKYEDPSQSHYPHPQPPYPYAARAPTQPPGSTVTSVPQPGAAPTFSGPISGISLASPVMPVMVSSPSSSNSPPPLLPLSSSPAPPTPPPKTPGNGSPSNSTSRTLESPSIAAAVASPSMSNRSQAQSAHSSVVTPHVLVPRSPQEY